MAENGNGIGSWGSWSAPVGAFDSELPPGAAEAPSFEPERVPQAVTAPAQRRVVTLAESGPALPTAHAPASNGALPIGASPPGTSQPMPPAAMTAYPPRQGMWPPYQFGQEPPPVVEPASPGFESHMLGASTLIVGAGSLVGGHFGGFYGGVAGALFAGSAINMMHAAHAYMKREPGYQKSLAVNGLYATLAAAMGGVVLWRFNVKNKGAIKKNPHTPKKNPRARRNAPRSCGMRPIGP